MFGNRLLVPAYVPKQQGLRRTRDSSRAYQVQPLFNFKQKCSAIGYWFPPTSLNNKDFGGRAIPVGRTKFSKIAIPETELLSIKPEGRRSTTEGEAL